VFFHVKKIKVHRFFIKTRIKIKGTNTKKFMGSKKFILTEHLRSERVFGQHSNTQEMEKERKRKHNL